MGQSGHGCDPSSPWFGSRIAAVLDRSSRYADYVGGASQTTKRTTGQLAESLQREPWLIGVAGMLAGGCSQSCSRRVRSSRIMLPRRAANCGSRPVNSAIRLRSVSANWQSPPTYTSPDGLQILSRQSANISKILAKCLPCGLFLRNGFAGPIRRMTESTRG
jgi:hypothetical protein